MSLVDIKEPMVYRATNAASDALSPRPTHHAMAKLGSGAPILAHCLQQTPYNVYLNHPKC